MSKKRKTVDASSDRILREAAVRFGAAGGKLTKLHHSLIMDEGETIIEKALYQYERDGKSFTLRLTIPEYVDFELIPGEVDWINYLADCGLLSLTLCQTGFSLEYFDMPCGELLKQDMLNGLVRIVILKKRQPPLRLDLEAKFE